MKYHELIFALPQDNSFCFVRAYIRKKERMIKGMSVYKYDFYVFNLFWGLPVWSYSVLYDIISRCQGHRVKPLQSDCTPPSVYMLSTEDAHPVIQ